MFSDIHGLLNFTVPEGDILLMAGDMCPAYYDKIFSITYQRKWLEEDFNKWLEELPIKEKILISGNHDWIFETSYNPKLNCHYLQDNSIEINGLKIHGSPWSLPFNNWAFNLPEKELEKKWELIPEDTDILLVHCPPYGIGDLVKHEAFVKHIGSKTLKKKILEVKPKLVVFGHNHNGYGEYNLEGIRCINVSLLDDNYKVKHKPVILKNSLKD